MGNLWKWSDNHWNLWNVFKVHNLSFPKSRYHLIFFQIIEEIFSIFVLSSAKLSTVPIEKLSALNNDASTKISSTTSTQLSDVLDYEKEEMMNDVYNKAMKKNFNDTGVFRCPVPNCNRIYSRRRSLSRHRQECGQLPRYLCSLCPYKSKRRDLLKSHMKHGHKLDHVREDQIIVRKDPPIVYH